MKPVLVLTVLAAVVAQSVAQWTNVALDKPALQTGTNGTGVANLAVDGIVVSNIGPNGRCSRTLVRTNTSAWWGVDLLRNYRIRQVIITAPADPSELNGASVLVGRIRSNLTACGTITGLTPTSGRTITLNCTARNVRLVGIFRASGGVISLCDVNVQGRLMNRRIRDARLVSLNRPTLMSLPAAPGFGGRRSVDGNINQTPTANLSCSMTQFVEDAFWRVDLGGWFRIDRVAVYAMRTAAGERLSLRDYIVQVSSNGLTRWRECETHYGIAESGSITVMSCGDRNRARFVRLRVRSVGRLAFCEVNVYGFPARAFRPRGGGGAGGAGGDRAAP